jgi:hypothetical protein
MEECQREAPVIARTSGVDRGGHQRGAARVRTRRPPTTPEGEQLGAGGEILGRAKLIGVLQGRRNSWIVAEPLRVLELTSSPGTLHPDLHRPIEDFPPFPGDLSLSTVPRVK